ncbi:MAG: nucleoside deaminase, partial [Bdellovibrionales bacterium]|nr:nucleoside deaminase [Bdellovibrionales bacterium]
MESVSHKDWMALAVAEARRAAAEGEVPVGAIVVVENRVVGRGHNLTESRADATLHAEMVALRAASATLGRWRLQDAKLYVTLEPCPMCTGALLLARVAEVYFGWWDPRMGAMGSLFDLAAHPDLPHQIRVYPETCADEC